MQTATRSKPDAAASARIQTEWKAKIRHLPPAKRERWLEREASRLLMAAGDHKARLKQCHRDRRRLLRTTCSSTWFDDSYEGGVAYPPPGMVLSRCAVSFEADGKLHPGQRWTPPQAVADEDECDAVSPDLANALWETRAWPMSASAVVLRRLQMLHGGNVKGSRGRGGRRLTPYQTDRGISFA